MTDIRELLREATEDLALERTDPVSRVQRATTRHRRTMAAIGCIVLAVVAAIVVPLAVVNGRTAGPRPIVSTPTPVPHARSVLQHWAPDDIEAAAGFGSIWGLSAAGNGNPGTSRVDELNPATGERIRRFSIPAPTVKITVGAGRVWVIGQNAGGGGTSYITTIDPTNGAIATLRLTNQRAEPYDIAISDGSAWVTFPLLGEVWRLTPSGRGLTGSGIVKRTVDIGGAPTEIAATGDGQLWVRHEIDGTGELLRIIPIGDSGELGEPARWPGEPFGASGGVALWVSSGARRATQLNPSQLSQCPTCLARGNGIKAAADITSVLQTPRGLFVVAGNRVDFYSFRAVESDAASPSSSIPVEQATSLAPDGPGVVIGTSTTGLIHWIPAS